MKQEKIYVNNENRLDPIDVPGAVCIAFVADDSFLDFLGVAINSIFINSSENRFYDIIVLTTCLSDKNIEKLLTLKEHRDNVSIRFAFINQFVDKMNFAVSDNYNKFTFYRLLLPEILETADRVLYLDADIIVNKDVSYLYDMEFDNYYLIGTYDVQIAAWQNYDSGMRAYFRALGISEPGCYVQAGVLLLNLDLIRKANIMHEAIMQGCKERFIFNDQDIINIFFKDKIKIVELNWNVLNLSEAGLESCKKYLNEQQGREYIRARKYPNIIHFTERSFPCYRTEGEFNQLYWEYAKGTPFYNNLIEKKRQYENDTVIQCQTEKNSYLTKKRYKTLLKEYAKKIPFAVKIVRYIKNRKLNYYADALDLRDMKVDDNSLITKTVVSLNPNAELSGLHYNLGKGKYRLIILLKCDEEILKTENIVATIYAGYRHIILLEKTLHIGVNKIEVELNEVQLDVELVVKNTSANKINIGPIKWYSQI